MIFTNIYDLIKKYPLSNKKQIKYDIIKLQYFKWERGNKNNLGSWWKTAWWVRGLGKLQKTMPKKSATWLCLPTNITNLNLTDVLFVSDFFKSTFDFNTAHSLRILFTIFHSHWLATAIFTHSLLLLFLFTVLVKSLSFYLTNETHSQS